MQKNDFEWKKVFPQLNYFEKNKSLELIKKHSNESITFYKNEKYEAATGECRKILELIFCYFNETNLQKTNDNASLNEKIKIFVNEWGRFLGDETKRSLYSVKEAGNSATHVSIRIKPLIEHYDVLNTYKKLHFILTSIVLKMIEPDELDEEASDLWIFNAEHLNTRAPKPTITEDDITKQQENSLTINNTLDIKKFSIVDFILKENHTFSVPIYQRKYVWTKDTHCRYFFDDVSSRMQDSEEHYFGTIAFKTVKKLGDNLLKIIDGQQRLTTSMLLLRAIYDQYQKRDELKGQITESLMSIFEKYSTFPKFRNPGATADDNDNFRSIMCGFKVKKTSAKFYDNYSYFYDRLSVFENSELVNFYTSFKDNFKVATTDFLEISNKKEMEIFENLNSLSAHLNLYDIIRNQLINLCSEESISNEKGQEEVAKLYIAKIESIYNDVRLETKEYSEIFKRIIQYIDGKEIKEKQSFKHTAGAIREYVEKTGHKESLNKKEFNNMLSEFSKYINAYKSLKNKKGVYNPHIFSGIKELLPHFNSSKHTVLIPFIFFAIDKYNLFDYKKADFVSPKKDDEEDLKDFLLGAMDLIAFHGTGEQGDSTFARDIYLELSKIKKEGSSGKGLNIIKRIKNEIGEKVTKKKIIENLQTKNTKWSITYFLYKLTYDRIDKKSFCIRVKSPTIEHFLPKDSTKWKDDIRKWNNIKSDDEFMHKVDKYLETIGNKFILPKSDNSRIKNKPLNEKQKTLKYIEKLLPLYYSENKKIDISKRTEFSFKNIEERTNELIEMILNSTKIYD